MFSKFKDDKSELNNFRNQEISRLIEKYKKLPDHHIKSKNGVLEAILLLEGNIETIKDVEVLREVQQIVSELKSISEKLDRLLG